jgi:hypothetical protein
LLPASYNENDLRSAVGASPIPTSSAIARKRRAASFGHDGDDDSDDPPRRRRTLAVPVFTISVGVAIAVLVLLGRANSDRYRLACEAERAVPQQGRAFPPWGTRALAGDAWTPLKITPETRCQPCETDDILALERQYLAMILDQATALLTAREVTALDDADALLKQALLLTRPPEAEPAGLAKERNQRHEDIQRLLGDVTYGRASAKLHDAATNLTDAAKQFDAAAAQHPRHATDASAWATYARHVAQELHAGPLGAAAPTAVAPTAAAPTAAAPTAEAPVADRPTAPLGVALPVEPGHPTPRDPAIPSTVDPAKPTASDPAPAAPPAVDASAPPGASPPAGGVLL